MTPSLTTYRHTHSFEYELTDAPTRPTPYARTNAEYQPERISFQLLDAGDGTLSLEYVAISGHKLSAKGTPTRFVATEHLYIRDGLPEFAIELVGQARLMITKGVKP
ncbi:MAG: hypothetical protein ACRD6W_11955 [Nitrososphaerales archaeon]